VLLGRPLSNVDLDLVIEGDAIAIAMACAATMQVPVTAHPTFRTATLDIGPASVDFVTARREHYPAPGSLPIVEPSTIRDDLERRDFTINALAIRLYPAPHDLLDPTGGLADLDHRLVRVLHDRSFQDDATRMLRAARYAAQLDFAIEARTGDLIRRDLRYMDTISGARIFHELRRTLESPSAPVACGVARRYGILAAIHPALAASEDVEAELMTAIRLDRDAAAPETLLCLLLRPGATEAEVRSLGQRLALPGTYARAVADFVAIEQRREAIDRPALRPSAVSQMLAPFALPALWAWSIRNEGTAAARHIRAYIETWRHVRPELRGDDLIALGVPPGPAVGQLLTRLRMARLDGLARSRADEIALIQEAISVPP
jgi:tRNA nucleotidyltransferase (CCA-adding enzyme)